jgi:hypothetical protein
MKKGQQVKNVKCKILDKQWIKRHANNPDITLELNQARRLAADGTVEIVDPINDNMKKTITTYKTKVLTAENGSYLTRNRFSSKKNSKIAYVQDYSKEGGAEISNKHVVTIGENLGFDVVGITPSNFHKNILFNADMIIINNFFEFEKLQHDVVMQAIYEKGIPFVKYDHDHRELKRVNFSKQLFTRSVLNIFLSPLHMEKSINAYGSQIKKHSVCLPLSINTKQFKRIENISREPNTVFVPCYRKCGRNVLDYMSKHRDKKYYVVCKDELNVNGISITRLPQQPIDKMIDLYNRYEIMLHLPLGFWAGERIYFEALLCGTDCVVNENVGHKSWDFTDKETIRNKLDKAPYTFWRLIEKCLHQMK